MNGSGSVDSSPAGIACGQACTATFAAGTQVQLVAHAAAGSLFARWDAECLPLPVPAGACVVQMSKDQTATATFEAQPPPPPPADECAGLMPAAVPSPVVATMSNRDSCIDAAGDDGVGSFLLGYFSGSGPVSPAYDFVQVRDGQAVVLGRIAHGDEGGFQVFSQPSGFTVFSSGPTGGSGIASYSHDGQLLSSQTIVNASPPFFPSSAVGIDPSGGTVAAAHYHDVQMGW